MKERDKMGEISDEEKAQNTICYCRTYSQNGEEREVCWSPGIIGIMSDEQKVGYCVDKVEKKPPEKIDTSILKKEFLGLGPEISEKDLKK